MSAGRRALALVLLAVLLPVPAQAAGRGREAAREFDEATRLFAQGDYRRAARRFLRAFELEPHGDAAYNAALAWERSGEQVRAAEAYAKALERELDEDARSDAERRFAQLRRSLGLLVVQAAEGAVVRVDDRSREAPAQFYVEPGAVDVVVVEAKRKRTRHLEIDAGEKRTLDFRRDAAGHVASGPREPSGGAGSELMPVLGWGALAAGGVLAGAGIFVGVRARDAREEFNASDRTDAERRADAQSLQTWTTVTFISAGVVTGAGVVILLADSGSARAAAVVAPAGAALRGSF